MPSIRASSTFLRNSVKSTYAGIRSTRRKPDSSVQSSEDVVVFVFVSLSVLLDVSKQTKKEFLL